MHPTDRLARAVLRANQRAWAPQGAERYLESLRESAISDSRLDLERERECQRLMDAHYDRVNKWHLERALVAGGQGRTARDAEWYGELVAWCVVLGLLGAAAFVVVEAVLNNGR